jgi:hypothetical protein
MNTPVFPITFRWKDTGEQEVFESMRDIECNVENLDSDMGEVIITDAYSRPVRIRIVLLNTEIFELLNQTCERLKVPATVLKSS